MSNLDKKREEDYANAYADFIRELKILTEDAEIQCLIKQYDNVAWEIKNFSIASINAMMNLETDHLSGPQKYNIMELNSLLNEIPDSVINVDNKKSSHLVAMKHPVWAEVRRTADNVLDILVDETNRVDSIIWKDR